MGSSLLSLILSSKFVDASFQYPLAQIASLQTFLLLHILVFQHL